jgi:tripartite-type tricarboxylate transporter receptor subunit TctC
MKSVMIVASLLAQCAIASAQSVEAFYKSHPITLVVGYGPGGGYDVYARLMARFLGHYIPGEPSVVVQNMPGAGSLRAANYVYVTAPKDGSTIGTFSRDMPLASILSANSNVQFDAREFTWLGSPSSYARDAYVLWTRKDAPIKKIEDAMGQGTTQLIVGATGDGASGSDITTLLSDVLKLRFKVISGYPDSGALYMAVDRHEIDARFSGFSSAQSSKAEWLKPDSPIHGLIQFGRATRHPLLPDVPTARELAPDDNARLMIEFAELPYILSRPFVAPPHIPADRARALQDGFMAATKDPDFLTESDKIGVEVSPVGAQDALDMLTKLAHAPEDVKTSMRRLIQHD